LPQLEEDDRLLPILRSFNQNAVATSYDPNKNAGNVTIKDLDEVKIFYLLHNALAFVQKWKSRSNLVTVPRLQKLKY